MTRHLQGDPGLLGLAARAADARTTRTRVGTGMAIGGFGLAALGFVIGGLMFISGIWPDGSCPYEGGSNCSSGGNNDDEVHAGLLIMLVGVGAGLGIGIPGVIWKDRPGELENEARARYHGMRLRPAPPNAALGPTGRPGTMVAFPLLSFPF